MAPTQPSAARRNNISRYQQLLKTDFSGLERQFIERRINEEKSALVAVSSFPLTLKTREPMFSLAA